jgi:predicted amidohydrolase YtcJ
VSAAASSLALVGGTVLVDGSFRAADVVVTGTEIGYVGAPGTAPPTDRRVDLRGAHLLPAFVDGHVHATDTGLTLGGLDLSGVRSAAELLDAVAARCRALRGRTLLGHGWDETAWEDRRLPTAQELDRATYGSFVYLSRVDVHSALVSGALLSATRPSVLPDGWSADGWVTRAAHHLVREAALGSLTGTQRSEAQRLALRTAAERGIAAVHEMGGPGTSSEDDTRALLALGADPTLPDVVGYWGQLAGDGGLEAMRRVGAHGAGGDLYVDGAIGSRTACLRSPYADDPHTSGALYHSVEAITDHLVRCTEAGVQAGFHVIGDAAMDAIVAGLVAAAAELGADRVRAARHRLEHAEMLDASQIAVLADLRVIASVQPAFDAAWGGEAGMYVDRLGTGRGPGLNPFAALADAGVELVLGSDAPVTPLDPWGGVRAAVHHRTPGRGITVGQALAAHTRTAHLAVGDLASGSLVPGAPATYAVWADLPLGKDGMPDLLDPDHRPTCLRTASRGGILHDTGDLEEVAA